MNFEGSFLKCPECYAIEMVDGNFRSM